MFKIIYFLVLETMLFVCITTTLTPKSRSFICAFYKDRLSLMRLNQTQPSRNCFGKNPCKVYPDIPRTENVNRQRTKTVYHPERPPKPAKYKFTTNDARFGPLSDLPDWTFADGRDRVMTPWEREKKLEQMDLARQVVQGLKELRIAKEEFRKAQDLANQQKEAYLAEKPAAKGTLSLRSSAVEASAS